MPPEWISPQPGPTFGQQDLPVPGDGPDPSLAAVVHELRTPLTSIIAALALVNDGVAGPLSDQAELLIEIAQRNSARLVELVDDLLEVEPIRTNAVVSARETGESS